MSVNFTREDAPLIGGIEDLEGKRLAIVKHLVVHSKIQNDYSGINLNFVFNQKVDENLDAVSFGRADACIINLAVASYFIQKKGLTNLRIAAPIDWEGIQLSMGVRSDWPVLLGIIKKGLSSITQKEKDNISQRWIRVKYEPGVDIGLIWRWSIGIGTGLFIIFFIVFAWNRRLQNEIAGRKKAEGALQKSEQLFRSVYHTAPLAFVIWDTKANVTDWNDKAEEIFGWSKNEIIGCNFFDFLIPENNLAHVEGIWEKHIEGNLTTHSVNENLTKNGNIITCEWNNSVLRDGKGEVIGGISLGFDITDRKLVEEEREQLISNLKTALDEIKTLKGIVPICSSCKKIRDDKGFWNLLEAYIETHSEASFSHGMCPDCSEEIYGDEVHLPTIMKEFFQDYLFAVRI